MAKSMENVARTLELVEKHLGAMHKATEKVAESGPNISKLGKHWAVMTAGATVAFEAVAKLVEKMGELGAEFVKDAIHSAAWEQTNTMAFKSLLGSAEAAEDMMGKVKSFGMQFAIPIADVAKSYQNMLQAGIKPVNLPIIMEAATDVQARTGGQTKASEITDAFAQIQGKGQLTSRSLMAFSRVLGEGGFDILGKKLGMNVHGFREFQKALEQTNVSAAAGSKALLETMAQTFGGKLGVASREAATTWEGVTTNMGNAWEIFTGQLAKTQAFKDLSQIVLNITNLFDENSESGRKLASQFKAITDKVDEFLAPLAAPGGLEKFIDHMENLLGTVITMVEIFGGLVLGVKAISSAMSIGKEVMKVYEGVMAAASAAGVVFEMVQVAIATGSWAAFAPMLAIVGPILAVAAGLFLLYEAFEHWDQIKAGFSALWAWVEGWGAKALHWFTDMGKNLIQGLVDGIMGAIFMVGDAIGHVASDAINKFRSVMGIHSPSTVMMGFGVNTAEGYQQGLEQGNLSQSLTMAMPSAAPSSTASRTGGQMKFELHQTFEIHGGGKGDEDMARHIVRLSASDLQSALDSFGQSMGTA